MALSLDVKITIHCKECDGDLAVIGMDKDMYGEIQLQVEPCKDCMDAARQEGVEKGEEDGRADGFSDGEKSGDEAGYARGYHEGKKDGHESGYADGKKDGYDEGFNAGSLDAEERHG